MKNTILSFVILSLVFTSCSKDDENNKIFWLDELDYYDGEKAYYFVDVGGKTAYLGGVLEIYDLLDNSYIDRITVESFDLMTRSDGYPLCRIWGLSGKLNKSTYLLARNCLNSN